MTFQDTKKAARTKAAATIRRQLRALQRGQEVLIEKHPYDRAVDQSYGASEALRWVLGEGPRPTALLNPLGTP